MVKISKLLVSILLLFSVASIAQSIEEGNKLLDYEQYAKAKKVFKDLVNTSSSNPTYRYYLGEALLKTDDYEGATKEFNKGLEIDPKKEALNYVGLGWVALLKGDVATADSKFAEAMSISKGKKYIIPYKIAEAYMSVEKVDGQKALIHANKAYEKMDDDEDVMIMLGDAYRVSGSSGKANSMYEKVIRKNAGNAKAMIKSGKVLVRAKSYNAAAEKFKQAVAADASYAPAYRELGELYYKAKKYSLAIENYEKYISMVDNEPSTMFRYAVFLFQSKKYDKALSQLNSLKSGGYSNKLIYRLMAYAQYELKDYSSAKSTMEKFMSEVEKDRVIAADYEYYGKILLKSGDDFAKAEENFAKAVSLDPEKASGYKEISDIYKEKGENLKAAEAYSKFVDGSKKKSLNDFMQVGLLYYKGKDYVNSEKYFTMIIDKKPDIAIAQLFKGRLVNLTTDTNEVKNGDAIPYFSKFIELAEGNKAKYKTKLVEVYDYFAYYHATKNERDQSKEYCNKTLALDPADPTAKAILESLKN